MPRLRSVLSPGVNALSRSLPARSARPVGYVLGTYPTTSQTFVQREILAMERLGQAVERISINPSGESDCHSSRDRRERENTYYVKSQPTRVIAMALLAAFTRSPLALARVLLLAIRTAGFDLKAALWRIFQVVEAAVVWRHCERRNIRHLHAHLGGVPATVAWFATELGNRLQRGDGDRWSWSVTVHGWHEFVNERDEMLLEKVAHADLVVCISDYTRSQLMRIAAPRDWPKIHVVRCGLDFTEVEPAPSRENRVRPNLLIVARLSPEKGHLVLLEACASLRERGVDVDLDVIGGGNFEGAIKAEVERLRLDDRVTFHGALGSSAISHHLSRATVFCLPSFAEGLPVSLMEAMAAGVPVVTTYISGIPELVVDGVTGMVVPAGRADCVADAVERLLVDREFCDRLTKDAEALVRECHDLSANVSALERLFVEVRAPLEARR